VAAASVSSVSSAIKVNGRILIARFLPPTVMA